MAYRRAGPELDRELSRLADEVRSLALRITPAYFARLDAALGDWRRAIDRTEGEPRDRLDALITLRDELTRAIAQAPVVEAALRALPRRVPFGVVGPRPPRTAVELKAAEWVDVPYARAQRLEAKLARVVGRLDPRARVRAWRGQAQVTAFEAHGGPMAIHAETLLLGGTAITAATAVARGAPRLSVRRQQWHHPFTTAVRWHVDTRVGDLGFDETFLVEGAQGARLLSSELREALLALSRFTPPELDVIDGAAILRFRYLFSPELVERTLRFLADLRHAPLPLTLVRT